MSPPLAPARSKGQAGTPAPLSAARPKPGRAEGRPLATRFEDLLPRESEGRDAARGRARTTAPAAPEGGGAHCRSCPPGPPGEAGRPPRLPGAGIFPARQGPALGDVPAPGASARQTPEGHADTPERQRPLLDRARHRLQHFYQGSSPKYCN